MPQITYADAMRDAVREEMRKDPRVFIMGLDIGFNLWGGDALREFGADRVRNTPISETAFVGAGIGAALTGMRPIVEIGCSTFLYSAMDQVVNQAAKSRYMFGGQANVPLVIRAPVAYSVAMAAHHSDRPWAIFAQAPGLKIIAPANPYDAKGLMKSALRDGNPVICFEDFNLFGKTGEVPDAEYIVPIGVADVKCEGSDVTIVSFAGAVLRAEEAAKELERDGISVEIVDLRSIVPLDRETVFASVAKTGRLIVVDLAPGMCSVASEVAASVAENSFENLRAPIKRITAPDVPIPFSPHLEQLVYPTVERIVAAARELCAYPRQKRGTGYRNTNMPAKALV